MKFPAILYTTGTKYLPRRSQLATIQHMTNYRCTWCLKNIHISPSTVTASTTGRFFCDQTCMIADRRKHQKSNSCEQCGKPCKWRASRTIRFCSKECCKLNFIANAVNEILICKECGKEFSRRPSRKAHFCSRECWKISESKKIRVDDLGYIHRGKKWQHRKLVEEFIGRTLTRHDTVHHINEITGDNRLENLYLFPTKSAHTAYHNNVKYGNCATITESNLESLRVK